MRAARVDILVEVKALPRLDHGVDVEGADLAAELHDVERGRIDGDVDAESLAAAGGEQRRENLAIVRLGEPGLDQLDAALVEQKFILVGGVDDDKARLVVFEMPLDQRQRSSADRAETDHDDRTRDATMNRPFAHVRTSNDARRGDAAS